MPIRHENKNRYPKNWKHIRATILGRAGHKCEFCGVPNYETIIRDFSNQWHLYSDTMSLNSTEGLLLFGDNPTVKIVLTIAHLDHTPENCNSDNLRALCQRCHLRYDAPRKARDMYQRRRATKAIKDLFS